MIEARRHNRVDYRLTVDLYCGEPATRRRCRTLDIGLGGMFAVGVLCMRPGDGLKASLGRREQGALQLTGRVARVSLEGAGLEFVGNSRDSLELLSELLIPDWDGNSLLDGVVKIAPWYQGEGLVGWMRLTSMVSNWRLLTLPARLEFEHSAKAGRPAGARRRPDHH